VVNAHIETDNETTWTGRGPLIRCCCLRLPNTNFVVRIFFSSCRACFVVGFRVPNVDGCAAVRGLAEESSSGDPALLFSLRRSCQVLPPTGILWHNKRRGFHLIDLSAANFSGRRRCSARLRSHPHGADGKMGKRVSALSKANSSNNNMKRERRGENAGKGRRPRQMGNHLNCTGNSWK
jgi:hypothetical protein